jgi:hypothetical protein
MCDGRQTTLRLRYKIPGTEYERAVFLPCRFFVNRKDTAMNWDRIAGNRKHFKYGVQEQRGNFADAHFAVVAGRRREIAREFRGPHGIALYVPERHASEWKYPRNVKDNFR